MTATPGVEAGVGGSFASAAQSVAAPSPAARKFIPAQPESAASHRASVAPRVSTRTGMPTNFDGSTAASGLFPNGSSCGSRSVA